MSISSYKNILKVRNFLYIAAKQFRYPVLKINCLYKFVKTNISLSIKYKYLLLLCVLYNEMHD